MNIDRGYKAYWRASLLRALRILHPVSSSVVIDDGNTPGGIDSSKATESVSPCEFQPCHEKLPPRNGTTLFDLTASASVASLVDRSNSTKNSEIFIPNASAIATSNSGLALAFSTSIATMSRLLHCANAANCSRLSPAFVRLKAITSPICTSIFPTQGPLRCFTEHILGGTRANRRRPLKLDWGTMCLFLWVLSMTAEH